MTITVYSDFDMELEPQQDGDITRDVSEDAIENSLKNIILTMQGSRRMLPSFASSIHNILFEPMTDETANLIRFKIVDIINRWDNRVDIKAINIKQDPDNNLYECYFEFNIKGFKDETKTVNFIIRRS
jgi:phage baseplate assembly protein W